jgi:DNA-binding GntR family transcriptional regulator
MTENSEALVDELAALIQTRVLNGEIATGTRLRQETLAAEFGVSRTPVREALRKLQATGLVEVQPRRGALVRGPTAREIREAYEVRAELEGLAAELAATRIRDGELRRLRDAQALFRRSVASLLAWRDRRKPDEAPPADAHEGWIDANDGFHLAIQEAAGNARLASTLADLHRSFPRDLTWLVLGENARLLEENVAQHEAILEAIERHDAETARRRMVEHVRSAGELVTRRFEERSQESDWPSM